MVFGGYERQTTGLGYVRALSVILLLLSSFPVASALEECIRTDSIEGGRPTSGRLVVSCHEAGSIKREYVITASCRNGKLRVLCANSRLKLWYHWSGYGSVGTPAGHVCKAYVNYQC
jgi:hypothetical protein